MLSSRQAGQRGKAGSSQPAVIDAPDTRPARSTGWSAAMTLCVWPPSADPSAAVEAEQEQRQQVEARCGVRQAAGAAAVAAGHEGDSAGSSDRKSNS